MRLEMCNVVADSICMWESGAHHLAMQHRLFSPVEEELVSVSIQIIIENM
jgi:hypothetical protein